MLVTMNQQFFDSLDEASLIWACIEPTIKKIRGKNSTVKTDAYADLSEGQKALLTFQVMHGHSSTGILEFLRLVPYLPSKGGILKELIKGMQYFGDDSMALLVSEMEEIYFTLEEKCFAKGIDIDNLDGNTELLSSIRQQDITFRKTIPSTIKAIGKHIRNNPSEFVQFEE